jgi:hypothetical protein
MKSLRASRRPWRYRRRRGPGRHLQVQWPSSRLRRHQQGSSLPSQHQAPLQSSSWCVRVHCDHHDRGLRHGLHVRVLVQRWRALPLQQSQAWACPFSVGCAMSVWYSLRIKRLSTYVTRSARDVWGAAAGRFAALTSISTRTGRLSILTPFKVDVALRACSCLLKMIVALPRLRPVGPYCSKTFLGLPTPGAEAKYSYAGY